ncbi:MULTISPECIES: DUF6531 domain-containing protein [Pseudomonas]|jgi:YD repeat-containing protein|uniref:DUF6531 domain-containing protein n=1 Tax=Pseudomonas TaxID=286 RepID=UPI0009E5CC7C|nr:MULTISPECIES: DUF6531 domain-containing protein [Pseudomonas]WAB94752.1 DUF6531 domain-containing protein [Pseudomonas citronellolis]
MHRFTLLAVAVMAPFTAQACSLSFTSPGDGATVRSPGITVYGQGGANAQEGDQGTVTATLNGVPFFNYSGSFTAAVSFLESRGVPVRLRPGQNFLFVSGSAGSCSASDTMTVTYDPEVTQAKNKGEPPPETCIGNPINLAVGNKYQREVDYLDKSSPLMEFARAYNSFDGYWRHNFSTRLVVGKTSIRLVHADGREVEFALAGNVATPPANELGSLKHEAGQWLFASADQEQGAFDGQGRLLSWRDASGRGVALDYSAAEITVTDDHGKSFRFTQDEKYQPLSFVAADSTVDYAYDSTRRLVSVKRSGQGSTGERRYLHENKLYPRFLTGIVDENGVRYATWTYDGQGRAISSEHANGAEKIVLAYNQDGSTTVTNEYGKKATYRFQVIHGIRKLVAVEGEPSPNCPASNSTFAYDERGLLTRRTDNNGNVTLYEYNERGLETSRREALGTPQERTILTQWHPRFYLPSQVEEPGRTIRYQYDEQGRQISQSFSTH